MAYLPLKLQGLRPTIEALMQIGGTPGLTFSVATGGVFVHHSACGRRNIELNLRVTYETVFPIGSLSMAFTAAAIGILVYEKKLKWDTRVKDVLSTFKSRDPILQNRLTITDLLCHRSGMSQSDNIVLGSENNILISGEDGVRFINTQIRMAPFRGWFSFNTFITTWSAASSSSVAGSATPTSSKHAFSTLSVSTEHSFNLPHQTPSTSPVATTLSTTPLPPQSQAPKPAATVSPARAPACGPLPET